jgi:hypothetical protein
MLQRYIARELYPLIIDASAPLPPRLDVGASTSRVPVRSHDLDDSGCIFVERCPRALPECAADPPVVEITPGHRAACVLAGTSKRVANSQTWAALRFSRRARMRPGWFPLCQGRDRLTEIPQATAWS